jgi:hypothetical protein
MNATDITSLWEMMFRYARHRGFRHHDAEDFVQDLFAKLYGKGILEKFIAVAESTAHLEALVVATAKRLLVDVKREEKAIKRGGEAAIMDLDEVTLCSREESPDRILQFQETVEVVEASESRLRDEYHRTGRGRVFEVLQECLTSGRGAVALEQAGRDLGMRPVAVRVNISRMKSRFRELVSVALAA